MPGSIAIPQENYSEDEDEEQLSIPDIISQSIERLRANPSPISQELLSQETLFIIQNRRNIINALSQNLHNQEEQELLAELFLSLPTSASVIPILQESLNANIEYDHFINLVTQDGVVSHEAWLNHLIYIYCHVNIFGMESPIMDMQEISQPPQSADSLLFSRLAIALNIASNNEISFPIIGRSITQDLQAIANENQAASPAPSMEPDQVLDPNGNPIQASRNEPKFLEYPDCPGR